MHSVLRSLLDSNEVRATKVEKEFPLPSFCASAKIKKLAVLIRHHSLDHPGLEFPGQGHGDGLGASPGFISVIGGLLPMAPCGRSSL